MHHPTSHRLLVAVLLVGAAVAVRSAAAQVAVPARSAPASAAADPKSPGVIPFFRPEEPPGRSLDANLFVQTSAEYRACCLQAYNLARFRVAAAVAKSTEPSGRLAVVLDLDETVIDNGAFQSMMIRSRLAYDQRLWDIWEAEHWDKWELVPGAKEFILEARAAGVTVIYISNRNARFHEQTRRGLERLGLPLADHAHLKLAADTTAITTAIGRRKNLVDRRAKDWGDSWIVIPNPMYGEWMKPLDRGLRDVDVLVPD